MLVLVIALAVLLVVIMAVAWWIVVSTDKSGWADVFWSFAIGITGVAAALWPLDAGGITGRQWLVALIVAVWSLRLGIHILQRTLQGGDDPRYAHLREQWGKSYRSKLLGFLEIQAAAAFILVIAVLIASRNPAPFGWQDGLGLVIAIAAVVGEAISDRQLAAFKRNPANRGKVCDQGFWALSRHPNYLFEWLVWIAYPVIAIGTWWAVLALAAPAMMYLLLVHVSGIPPLEAHMLRAHPQAFADYKRRVRAFWPWPKTEEGSQ